MPVYKRLVEVGRVAFIAKGKDQGKLATIVNVIDGNHVLVDGPSSGVSRGSRNLKDLQLTKFKTNVRVGQRTKGVKKAFDEGKVADKFSQTKWAKNIVNKQKRANLTDFERFKLMRAKQLRNRLVRVELAKLRKAAKH
ncbi:unnamed protein product, partial [Mesorhabditis belari]|uniref:Large ribosomal subunit protein eL14 n=1 Tax=Mesorhabditis belari TaxID=2138241 RepID=A0AAF3F5I0_9BILA